VINVSFVFLSDYFQTITWVASRRPQAIDMVELFMKGHGKTVEDGGLITELV